MTQALVPIDPSNPAGRNVLAGKVALVTGAASGIGEAIATRFALEGCTVVIADIQVDKGRAVAARLGERARFIELDVTSEARWGEAVKQIVQEFGRLDVLVNNAGAASAVQRMDKESPEDFEQIMRLNVTGVWLGIRAAVAPMRSQAGGSIIITSSIDAFMGVAGMTTYVSTKFAVTGMARSAALELGGMGIRVNTIHPGIIGTPAVAALAPNVLAELEAAVANQPIKRVGRPDEVAAAALFFASDDSSYCTGSMLLVDGGHTAGRNRVLGD